MSTYGSFTSDAVRRRAGAPERIRCELAFTVYVCISNKKLRYRRGTARRAMSIEIMSSSAQLYEKSHMKGLQ